VEHARYPKAILDQSRSAISPLKAATDSAIPLPRPSPAAAACEVVATPEAVLDPVADDVGEAVVEEAEEVEDVLLALEAFHCARTKLTASVSYFWKYIPSVTRSVLTFVFTIPRVWGTYGFQTYFQRRNRCRQCRTTT
jgi:hypothetical protein